MELEEKVAIIDAYADVLANAGSLVIRESELPYPKDVISEVLLSELSGTDDPDAKAILNEGFVRLELFLPDNEFEPVSKYLEYIGELTNSESEPSEIFKQAAEQVPTTNEEVHDIFVGIDERIAKRKAEIEAL